MASARTRSRPGFPRSDVFVGAAPSCPKCARPMTPRNAKGRAGTEYNFWGCVAFPACLGARRLR